MAYEPRDIRGARRSRQHMWERDERTNGRVRRLRGAYHPYRWCPDEEVSILVGPDYRCPACGKPTSAS